MDPVLDARCGEPADEDLQGVPHKERHGEKRHGARVVTEDDFEYRHAERERLVHLMGLADQEKRFTKKGFIQLIP